MSRISDRATRRSRPIAGETQPTTPNGQSSGGREPSGSGTAEERRLAEARERTAHWKRWGPYLSDRSWGTVREDYSADGSAWEYFPHDHARSRTYRWNEDGIAGISDRHQLICFAPACWNGRDPILKERLFGLAGSEGNHGEDVKECYYHLDSTPTHSYMRFLYKYPHAEFPYSHLVEENRRRDRSQPEFELTDTGVFDEDRYFDVFVEYAKRSVEEILIRIVAVNRGPEPTKLHLLPTVWFRNTWCWADEGPKPRVTLASRTREATTFHLWHPHYGERWLIAGGAPEPLFTENETNTERLFGVPNDTPHVKDGIHEYVVHGRADRVNPEQAGTKGAAHYQRTLPPGEEWELRLRLTDQVPEGRDSARLGAEWERVFAERREEADEFYATVIPPHLSADARGVMRQAFAGLLWSKQHYHYVVRHWLTGDPAQPAPPPQRECGRNCAWSHLHNTDVISMPDAWEYPWYASWDLAFHTIPLALVDPDFAKEQLILLLREWYMHPNGQLPAYEWAFGDVNPPVHAWAARRVYQIEKKRHGVGDTHFLERVFHKLLLNFNWWVNRKDVEGRNLFQGGFLGMDNIGVFDRSAPLPTGGHLDQSDGTAWMAQFCLNMLAIAVELARTNPAYEDVASKFWEHFLYIADALTCIGQGGVGMWSEEDGFFYDVLHLPDGRNYPLKVRSLVGLLPLMAVETLDSEMVDRLPGFKRRMEWFIQHRKDLTANVACMETPGEGARRLLAVVWPERLRRVLAVMLDPKEFLSPHGIRSVSRRHRDQPYVLRWRGEEHVVRYDPGDSTTGLFGGNSNWRGPVWFPMNYLLIEALQKFHHYLGDDFQVECPTGSGRWMHLGDVAAELSRRLSHLFLRDGEGRRPAHGHDERYQRDPHWRDLVLFYEYFHGEDGSGVGASHQTGWTALVAKLIQQSGE